jgi:hypothetical protein
MLQFCSIEIEDTHSAKTSAPKGFPATALFLLLDVKILGDVCKKGEMMVLCTFKPKVIS